MRGPRRVRGPTGRKARDINDVEIERKRKKQGPKKKVTLVVPCYNEQSTLPYLEKTLKAFAAENDATLDLSYVMVDDGSSDDTWATLQELFADRADCTLVKHKVNGGIAAATMTGIKAAKDEIVCSIDCDCTFDPHELASMIPLLTDDVDMVQASPYHPKGGVVTSPAGGCSCPRIYRASMDVFSTIDFQATRHVSVFTGAPRSSIFGLRMVGSSASWRFSFSWIAPVQKSLNIRPSWKRAYSVCPR